MLMQIELGLACSCVYTTPPKGSTLGHGVMVAQQTLTLFVKVRVLMPQLLRFLDLSAQLV